MYKSYRNQLINNLKFNTYCRIGLSKICGVGVIAIKPIDINIDPFQTVFKLNTTSLSLTEKEVESLEPGIVQLIKDFFMKTADGEYPVYYNGLNAMDIAYYLNHSDTPNVMMVYEPNDKDEDFPNMSANTDKKMDMDSNKDSNRDTDNNDMDNKDSMPDEVSEAYYTFKTIRPIMVGEELTIDYYQNARSLEEILEIRKQFQIPFPAYALKLKK